MNPIFFFSRSYLEGLRLGYLTQDPSQFNDPNVCDPYIQGPRSTGSRALASHVSSIIIWLFILIQLIQTSWIWLWAKRERSCGHLSRASQGSEKKRQHCPWVMEPKRGSRLVTVIPHSFVTKNCPRVDEWMSVTWGQASESLDRISKLCRILCSMSKFGIFKLAVNKISDGFFIIRGRLKMP